MPPEDNPAADVQPTREEWDDYERDCCPVCGSDMEWLDCWNCFGDGGFHDCGEDCCPCLHPEADLNETCQECDGEGGYRQCLALPHSKEQMERARKP